MKIEDHFDVRQAVGEPWEGSDHEGKWWAMAHRNVTHYLRSDGVVRSGTTGQLGDPGPSGWFETREDVVEAFEKWSRREAVDNLKVEVTVDGIFNLGWLEAILGRKPREIEHRHDAETYADGYAMGVETLPNLHETTKAMRKLGQIKST